MSGQHKNQDHHLPTVGGGARERLLAGLPVTERLLQLNGISTAVLEGGDGPPVVPLHGPGESALWWMRVIPQLAAKHRVIVPDLPAHGASRAGDGPLDADRVFAWLSELIKQTCPAPPPLVGHSLGGAIAARFAVRQHAGLSNLVLVDSFGLGPFRPALGFAYALIRFQMRPNERNYKRFLPQCMFDPDSLARRMGELWQPFLEYNLECARSPQAKAARRLLGEFAMKRIAEADLERIAVPTALIWGRHDRALKLRIAPAASKRHGWPLYVIEDARDDPKLEQPEAFMQALHTALATPASLGRKKAS